MAALAAGTVLDENTASVIDVMVLYTKKAQLNAGGKS